MIKLRVDIFEAEFNCQFFSSPGIVAISTNTLRILALEKLGAVFNQAAYPLDFTPRKFILHPESASLVIIETDHNAYTEETKQSRWEINLRK